MALTFYDAACYIEQADSMLISREDMIRIDELFQRAMENITSLRATPFRSFGKKFSTITDMRSLMLAFPANWGVSIHRKPAQSQEGGVWTCQISMTSSIKDRSSLSNSVAGRSIAMEGAIIAAILRIGQHLEINKLTDPTPSNDLPPIAA